MAAAEECLARFGAPAGDGEDDDELPDNDDITELRHKDSWLPYAMNLHGDLLCQRPGKQLVCPALH
jgi:hypothetical protein